MAETEKTAPKASGFDFGGCFKGSLDVVKGTFVKPASEGASKLDKFKDAKFTGFFVVFAILIETVITLITAIFSTVVTKSYNLFSGETKTSINWGNLEHFDFWKTLGNGLLYGAIIIAVVAVIAYVVALVMKKSPNFLKLAGIVAAGIIPYFACCLLGAILGLLSTDLNMIVTIIGLVYSGTLVISGIDKEVAAEGDKKVYFHALSISIVVILLYYISINILKSSIFGGLGL